MPAETPDAIPDVVPIVAMPVAPELQMPPYVALVKLVVEPIHTTGVPVIFDGNELTVTVLITAQPVGKV